MIKILLIFIALFFSACVNTHGISTKYYSECEEYYDLQGYYHKDCNDDMVTYKEMDEAVDYILYYEDDKPQGNVW